MHPSKVTLRAKVRRPMAWDSTKSAPSVQCRVPGGYRRAEAPHIESQPARRRQDERQPAWSSWMVPSFRTPRQTSASTDVASGAPLGYALPPGRHDECQTRGFDSWRFAHGVTLGMAVGREFWRLGLGSALLESLLLWGDSHGVVRVALEVVETNTPAIRLYESLGFEHEGRLRARRKHGDVYLDDYMMSRVRTGLGPA